jgi:hypothetical protein
LFRAGRGGIKRSMRLGGLELGTTTQHRTAQWALRRLGYSNSINYQNSDIPLRDVISGYLDIRILGYPSYFGYPLSGY